MYIKRAPTLIFYPKLSKNLWESYFFNTQIGGCFRKRTVLLDKMLWYEKSMERFKTCVTQERVEGSLAKKKSNKKWRRGSGHSQKKWFHSLKKTRFCKWCAFRMTPKILTYFAVFLWVYLLMMLLALFETNKPYISK